VLPTLLPLPALGAALALAALVAPVTTASGPPGAAIRPAPQQASTTGVPVAVALPDGDPGYRVPAAGDVLRLFDPPEVRWGAGHRGVDLGAVPGDPVVAPAAGVVTVAGTVVDRGVVTIRHPDGLRSSLEPVAPGVQVGDVVEAGQPVGVLTDRPAHPGLHWGVRAGETYLDPLGLLPPAGPVVLLPAG
jgi:murein DD-endopeptidase MepM/ murein hydrolase activator NlpD